MTKRPTIHKPPTPANDRPGLGSTSGCGWFILAALALAALLAILIGWRP